MKVTISKTEIKGKVAIPSSKSMTIRALFCAALSKGESLIHHPLRSDDTNSAAQALGKIGVKIEDIDNVWHVKGGTFKIPTEEVYCGESATTLRLMTALVALLPGTIKLTGGPSLTQRPIRALVDALKMLGVKGSLAGLMTPPVTIYGGTMRGGTADIAGNISSQYISALLMIGSFAPTETIIRLTTPLTSRPYILMTLWCLRKFKIIVKRDGNSFIVKRQRYEPTTINIEGDWSSASYFLALGVLSEEGLQLENISTTSLQGDRVLLDYMRIMGINVAISTNTITVFKCAQIKPIHVDISDCIDLLPTIAVLAALADGESEIRGIQRARIKESNRVAAVKEGLTKLGVTVIEFKEYITVKGMNTQKKTEEDGSQETMLEKAEEFFVEEKENRVVIDSHNDHRIAMAFAVLGVAVGGVTITDAECVTKTYPSFWEDLKNVGGVFTSDE